MSDEKLQDTNTNDNINNSSDLSIRVAGQVDASIEDGPGYRFVLFTQGCSHNCKGCHNPQTHSFDGGYLTTINELIKKIKRNPLLDGVTLSGGEPFEQAAALSILAKEIKDIGLSVITYTGYTYEEIINSNNQSWLELLKNTDLLIDGEYIESLHTWEMPFRGSSNQRIIDVAKSLQSGQAIDWEQPVYSEY